MRAFLLGMALQTLLLLVLFAGVWKYTADILDREEELASRVLPNLELAHHFTSATAGLQSQGLLLRSAETIDDLQLRKQLLEEAIAETRLLIQTRTTLGEGDIDSLADTIDQIQNSVVGLSDVRGQQILQRQQLQKETGSQILRLESLLEVVQERVMILTDSLLDTRETLSDFAERRLLSNLSPNNEDYFLALDRFESSSLIIQDYLLFNQDLVSLRSILERLPLLQSADQVVASRQNRDLLIQSMVGRAIYIQDRAGNDLLLGPLTEIRSALRDEGNPFDRQSNLLDVDAAQSELSAHLARLTIDVPAVTEKIRSESEGTLLRITEATREGLERYRWFLFIVLILSVMILGSVGYWLLYRRTVVPLGEIAAKLDDVGTERFRVRDSAYFIREIQVLSRAVGELDQVQKQMKRKDLELNASNDELRKANEDLEQFVHIASHDLQEPLRKLQQFSGLLSEDYNDKLDDDGRFYLKAIANSAGSMSRLISDTLAYARSTRRDLTQRDIDLNELMRTVYEDTDIAIAEAGAHVTIGKLPMVSANRAGMTQLFGNLLINAVKYRRENVHCLIDINARLDDGEAAVIIDFQDNGIGIEEQFLEKVFIPFERLGSQSVSGTGLGLAICAKICDAHGWHISVSSQPGVGSCFHVHIPEDAIVKELAESRKTG